MYLTPGPITGTHSAFFSLLNRLYTNIGFEPQPSELRTSTFQVSVQILQKFFSKYE